MVRVIAPVIPPQTPLQQLIEGARFPHPSPVRVPSADVMYGMSTVGEAGRVLDRKVFAGLGWAPGTRLTVRCDDHGVLVASADPEGSVLVREGFVRIPYRQRRRVNLFVGDRVLLLGRQTRQRLAIAPPAAMEELFAAGLALLER
ncbi:MULTISPECIES: hypothetical protein [Nocardia]|uniref:hypothetical protein n=1 Tax=Nocardia TaxID=1817 RepID=UPI0007A51B24|nr:MULTISPECIES: hypothetical protein [Nocardia]MCC3311447.1 hypothetical protein [Nocardia africana]